MSKVRKLEVASPAINKAIAPKMENEKGSKAAPRKRTNSKAELSDFKMEFEEIKEEFKKLRDMYLGPLLETNGRITNQLKKMEEEVNKNTAAIEICQREIEELNVAADVGPSAKTTQMTVEDLVKEATLQIKNSKQLFISKCEKEEKVKETLNNILERDAKIGRIIDLDKKIKR